VIASECAASFGAISRCSFCSSGLVLAPFRAKNTRLVRASSCPAFSIATTVFSKLGGAWLPAIAAISRRCSAMPCSKAGPKCSVLILSKGGYWKGSELSRSRGFSSVMGLSGDWALAAGTTPRQRVEQTVSVVTNVMERIMAER